MKHKYINTEIVLFIGIILLLLVSRILFSQLGWRENMSTQELESLTDPSKGFCETYRGKSHQLESRCNRLVEGRCKTMECCVWTNSSKCVAGNSNGPTYKTNQNGKEINFGNYYYKNKCYGKCS